MATVSGAPAFAETPASDAHRPGEFPDFSPTGDIRRLSGETLIFNIGFLVFPEAASAQIRFFRDNEIYQSELIAETRGVVGFFTAYRKHVYRSKFDVIENGRRLRTKIFEREVIIGKQSERTVHYLDYKNRRHHWFLYQNDKMKESHNEIIPEGVIFDDVLAAFYNFRNGVYGELEEGRDYNIQTLPDQSMTHIAVSIEKDDDRKAFSDLTRRPDADDLLALRVIVPKDVFKTTTGELLFWASRNYIPLETTVKNYILLGDLHAQFERRIFQNSQIAAVSGSN